VVAGVWLVVGSGWGAEKVKRKRSAFHQTIIVSSVDFFFDFFRKLFHFD